MSIGPSIQKVTLTGEDWVRITEPDGWRNTVTDVTAGEPWMLARLAEEEQSQ